MNLEERAACDGLDDASIMETMEWLHEQCVILHSMLESTSGITPATEDRGGAEMPLPTGGSEQ
jgi:hypothetical protein